MKLIIRFFIFNLIFLPALWACGSCPVFMGVEQARSHVQGIVMGSFQSSSNSFTGEYIPFLVDTTLWGTSWSQGTILQLRTRQGMCKYGYRSHNMKQVVLLGSCQGLFCEYPTPCAVKQYSIHNDTLSNEKESFPLIFLVNLFKAKL